MHKFRKTKVGFRAKPLTTFRIKREIRVFSNSIVLFNFVIDPRVILVSKTSPSKSTISSCSTSRSLHKTIFSTDYSMAIRITSILAQRMNLRSCSRDQLSSFGRNQLTIKWEFVGGLETFMKSNEI